MQSLEIELLQRLEVQVLASGLCGSWRCRSTAFGQTFRNGAVASRVTELSAEYKLLRKGGAGMCYGCRETVPGWSTGAC